MDDAAWKEKIRLESDTYKGVARYLEARGVQRPSLEILKSEAIHGALLKLTCEDASRSGSTIAMGIEVDDDPKLWPSIDKLGEAFLTRDPGCVVIIPQLPSEVLAGEVLSTLKQRGVNVVWCRMLKSVSSFGRVFVVDFTNGHPNDDIIRYGKALDDDISKWPTAASIIEDIITRRNPDDFSPAAKWQ